ncbi:hypothetical protein [Synechococcus sp. PCC 7336]|uniref:hypothetical protein n=1 Tax=Synechococcus sp. PCC 7336 TaxID=195250 RepID=UPI000349135B|nr:hypothetical protein [Synechococcus sp. PCC 7336]
MKMSRILEAIAIAATVMVGTTTVEANERSADGLLSQGHHRGEVEAATEHSRELPSHHGHTGGSDRHQPFEVASDRPIPAIELTVREDSLKGWNLEVRVTNFSFAPASVNEGSSSQNEGHAHLYIDGEKVTRLYGNWFYLGELDAGDREISVTLNTNRHETLVHNSEVLSATTTITVPDTVAAQ